MRSWWWCGGGERDKLSGAIHVDIQSCPKPVKLAPNRHSRRSQCWCITMEWKTMVNGYQLFWNHDLDPATGSVCCCRKPHEDDQQLSHTKTSRWTAGSVFHSCFAWHRVTCFQQQLLPEWRLDMYQGRI